MTSISLKTPLHLGVPPVLITVLGQAICKWALCTYSLSVFSSLLCIRCCHRLCHCIPRIEWVSLEWAPFTSFPFWIKFHHSYDRYWMGRCCWSDLIRTCRTMGRLIWFHVPLRVDKDGTVSEDSASRVMREKRLALELIEGYALNLRLLYEVPPFIV